MTATGFFVPRKQTFFEKQLLGVNRNQLRLKRLDEKLKKRLICALRVNNDAWSCSREESRCKIVKYFF